MRVGDDVAVLRDDDAAARAVESLLTAVVYIDLNIYDGILDCGYQVSCVGVCAVAVALGSSGGGVVDNAGLKRVQYVLRALGDAAFGSAGACGAVRRGAYALGLGGSAFQELARLVSCEGSAESRAAAEYRYRCHDGYDLSGAVGPGLLRGLLFGEVHFGLCILSALYVLGVLCIMKFLCILCLVHAVIVIHKSFVLSFRPDM